MRSFRLPGSSTPRRLLAAVAVYAVFAVLLLAAFRVASIPLEDGRTDLGRVPAPVAGPTGD